MITLTWAALLYAALTALCLSLNRHHRDVFHGRPTRLSQQQLRWLGCAGIVLSLIYCLLNAPGGRAWVQWFCTLAALGYGLNFGLAYVPRALPRSGVVALGMAVSGVCYAIAQCHGPGGAAL